MNSWSVVNEERVLHCNPGILVPSPVRCSVYILVQSTLRLKSGFFYLSNFFPSFYSPDILGSSPVYSSQGLVLLFLVWFLSLFLVCFFPCFSLFPLLFLVQFKSSSLLVQFFFYSILYSKGSCMILILVQFSLCPDNPLYRVLQNFSREVEGPWLREGGRERVHDLITIFFSREP